MNLRLYRIFLKVCEEGTMTAAARQMYMTQPSVSQAIAELEKEYSVRLFERMNHKLFLTAAGVQLRSYASHILNLSEQAKKELSELGRAGKLSVGVSQTVGAHLLPGILQAYRFQMPEVDLFSVVDNTRVIENMLLEDQIDVGLVEGAIHSDYINQERLCEDELIIICGQEHSFWGKESLRMADLENQAFFIRESGSGTRDLFERVMAEAGIRWKIAGVHNNTEAIKKAVIKNLALAVVPKISIVDEEERGLIRGVPTLGLDLKRQFNLVVHQQKYFTDAITVFIETCKTLMSV